MSNQELLESEGVGRTQDGPGVETPADETTRKAWGTTPLPGMGCDFRTSEYFTKNPVLSSRSPLAKTQRRLRGQPTKLDAQRKKFVAIMVSLGFSLRQIARNLQIDHSTISRAAQRDREFSAALARAKAERSLHPQFGFRGWRAALDVIQRIGMKW